MSNQAILSIKKNLPNSWGVFFSRFGSLTPIQQQAIPYILDGKNTIIVSPTASGKTEAVIAPVAQMFISERWERLSVLYIVPTRALANDVLHRIQDPLREINIKTALKHGDKPTLSKKIPNFLITTPESLDSLICRHSELFTNIQTIILDEIHLLDNTYRGDQLRILLERLRQIKSNIHIHLLSATIYNPSDVATRYVSNFKIISVNDMRNIDYYLLKSHTEIFNLIREKGFKKILYFCNLRQSVENTAAILNKLWAPYPVVVHHGRLSRRIREEAELTMKQSSVACCVSTSTLEVGIDIGDIDFVVLCEPPWSISSLLQRIGRGSRRNKTVHTAALVLSDEEKDTLEMMFNLANSGNFSVYSYTPHLSVIIQQIFSILYQHPNGFPQAEFTKIFSNFCSVEKLNAILEHLKNKGFVGHQAGYWHPSTQLMDMGERGTIHSNIPDFPGYQVVDIASGKIIGKISRTFDKIFVLNKRTWEVISVFQNTIKVKHIKAKALAPKFGTYYNKGAFYYLLPEELK